MKERGKLRRNQFLRNKKSFMFLLILCLGIGFAFLSTQLNITGNTSVSGNKWSVYFDNVQVTDGSVDASVVPTTMSTTTTSIEYTVNLDKPGDFYEFTVDAVNAGTIDAMIESITTPNIDSRVLQYVNYTATYDDGTSLAQNDVLDSKITTTYKVRVEYKKDISASDLSEDDINLTLTFGVNYVQSTLKYKISKFIKLVNDSAVMDTNINFSIASSNTNGKGLYIKNGTEENIYPIYYYRGNVTNNNAKFAGFCWKIVRTTETGGTKLIYNGIPNDNGECANTTGNSTQLSTLSAFNLYANSPAYNGYMYGTAYNSNVKTMNENDLYGKGFKYENGMYTLSDTNEGVDNTHHYTCFNEEGTCAELSYVFYFNTGNNLTIYITLANGKSVEDALEEMNTNSNDSKIKSVIDNWFKNTFASYFTDLDKDYNDYLEDTIWCNDRSMNVLGADEKYTNNGWNPNGGNTSNYLYYSAYGRMSLGTPNLACSNKNDAFTVNDTKNGNGALTYPVGLLTSDEIMLAGSPTTGNGSYYLYNRTSWWTMSPSFFNYDNRTGEFHSRDNSAVQYRRTDDSLGVRPSISLRPEVKIAEGGDGSSATPYEFVVE